MGMIFFLIYIFLIFFIFFPHNNHIRRFPCSLSFSIFLAISYISCLFYSAFHSIPSFPFSSLRRFVFRRGPRCVERSVPFRSVPFRSVPFRSVSRLVFRFVSFVRLVHVGSWGGAPFLSARFLVSSCHERAFPGGGVVLRFGLSSRGDVAVSSIVPSIASPIVPPVGSPRRFGFVASRRSSREIVSKGVSFPSVVLASSFALPYPSSLIG